MVDLISKYNSKDNENEVCFLYLGHDNYPNGGFFLHLVHRGLTKDPNGSVILGKPRLTEEVILERNAPYDAKKYDGYIRRFQQDPEALRAYFPNVL